MSELQRLQLGERCRAWKHIASEGFCTMSAPLSSWVQTRAQVESAARKRYLGLKPMARMLPIPGCDTLIAQHHNAGADAHITCLIYITVLRIAAAVQCDGGDLCALGQCEQGRRATRQ